jgi:hypothetical protein
MHPTKAELLNRDFLARAKARAALTAAGARDQAIVLRPARFCAIILSSPTLISYEPDYHSSVPGWPKYRPVFETCPIVLSDAAHEERAS